MSKWTVIGLLLLLLAGVAGASDTNANTSTNTITWHRDTDRVDANVRGMALWPLLEQIARGAGWHIFVEPNIARPASAKFKNLPSGEALKRLLGDLNYALVPQSNAVPHLYVFRTTQKNATQRVYAPPGPPRRVPNELLVRLKPGAKIEDIAKALGAKITGRNDKLNLYRLLFDNAEDTDAALGKLKSNSDVAEVDYNYYFDPPPAPQLMANDNAPQPPVALTLDPPNQNDPCNVVVGMIDTPLQSLGATLDPFLLKSISVAGDPCTNSAGPTHATGMAQTILRAVSQAGGGSTSARILPVDVYGCGEATTSWNVAMGIQAAVDKGANVLNLSLGSSGDSAVLDSIVKQAVADGILVFAAAGNQPGTAATYPAADPGVIAVTALQQPGQIAPYANSGSFVDLALPGASVIYLNGQAYMMQGTSVSTAYATGVATGTKTSTCAGWPQIQGALQQKFPVPSQ